MKLGLDSVSLFISIGNEDSLQISVQRNVKGNDVQTEVQLCNKTLLLLEEDKEEPGQDFGTLVLSCGANGCVLEHLQALLAASSNKHSKPVVKKVSVGKPYMYELDEALTAPRKKKFKLAHVSSLAASGYMYEGEQKGWERLCFLNDTIKFFEELVEKGSSEQLFKDRCFKSLVESGVSNINPSIVQFLWKSRTRIRLKPSFEKNFIIDSNHLHIVICGVSFEKSKNNFRQKFEEISKDIYPSDELIQPVFNPCESIYDNTRFDVSDVNSSSTVIECQLDISKGQSSEANIDRKFANILSFLNFIREFDPPKSDDYQFTTIVDRDLDSGQCFDMPPLPNEWRADNLAVVHQLLEAGANRQILQAVEESVTIRVDSDIDESVEESVTKMTSDIETELAQAPVKKGIPSQEDIECGPLILSNWWLAVAEALQNEGMYESAIRILEGVVEHGLNNGLLDHVCLANHRLGVIKLNHNQPTVAIQYFEKAVQSYSSCDKNKLVTQCALFSKLGMAHKNARDIGPAVLSYKQAIAAGESDFSESVSFLAGSHINLGNLFHSVGDHTAAVPHYKKGIELTEQCCDMVSHAWAHGNLGNTFLSLSQHKEAFDHLQMSLDLTLQHEPTPTAIGRAYNNLGTYYQAVGDLDKAKECYDTALGQGVYGQDQAGQARAYGNIGNVYMLEKNPERAVPHYSEVLRLTRDRLTAAVAHHNRGCAYFELGQKNKFLEQRPNHYLVCGEVASQMESEHRLPCTFPDDVKHYHRALKDLDKVIVGHEETFASIKGSSSGLNLSVAWFETNAKTFLRAQDCAYSIGDHNRALVYAEQCRARTLGELLNNKTSCIGSALSTPLQSDSISSIVKHLKIPNVPVVVLSYTGTRLLVWVLVWDGEEVKMTSFEQRPDEAMFDGKTFDHYIRYSLSEMLTGGLQLYGGLEDQTISDESPVAKLFDLIGKPLLRILEMMGCSGSRMVLVPDSYTKLLPFSALYDTKRQCFLGDSHSIVYSPSLLTLGVMSQIPPVAVQVPLDSKDMCVVGNPTTPPFMYNKEEWDLGPLPYATEEARSVAHLLQTTPLLHQDATKNAVLAKISQAKVIHLATHGSAGGGFLVLGSSSHNFATVTKHTVEDPSALLLHASELESLDISAALVVLSSCDSGRGVIRGDDIQGMARSFLLAGARAVLTSLWKAPDESASFFMLYFYRYLLDGHKASVALQKTSHSIRCFVKYSNFVHWSGHQLTGQDVMVTQTLSSEDKAVRDSLGNKSTTTFPRFDLLHSLTDALNSDNVQLLYGPPGVDMVEPVTDFICKNYSHYPGGIVWLHGSHSIDVLQMMSETSDRVLVILDGCDEIHPTCPKSSNIDIIIISNGVADDMRCHVRSSLNRPVSVHAVKPLSELHATQRLVYSVQSSFHLPPSTADQSSFQQLAHLTMGSPILIRMVQYLLHHNMKHSSSPSEGLLYTVHSIEEMMEDDDELATGRLAVISAVCDTLSTAAQRLLHCLSCLNGLPVSLEYIEIIANMIQPRHQPTLVTELRQAAVLLGYPSRVVIGPTSDKTPLLYVPVSIAESIWSESSLHNKALSLLVIKNAIMKGPSYCDTAVCHQVLKSCRRQQ